MTRVTQEHVDARRDTILEAAARLFARKGVAGATMADIAREANLSAGAIYRYYSSKEDLLRAVFDDAVRRNQKMFQGAAETASSPLEAMQKVGRKVWIDLDDHDALICEIQMALNAAREPDDFGVDLSRMRKGVRDLLEGMIRQAQASGEIDPHVDPAALALLLQACTGGIQMLKLDPHEDVDVESAFDLLVRMVLGLRTLPEPTDRR